MNLVYNIFIRIYIGAIYISSPFMPKARLMIKGRKKWKQDLKSRIESNSEYVWFHCSSLGEFEQGRPLIEKYRKERPEHKIILTFFSPSGYEIRKNYELADIVMYLPFDTASNVKQFLKIVNPHKAFFIKYDFWRNFLIHLKKREVNTYLVSAIFRQNQLFFKWYGKAYKNLLNCFTHLFVQNNESQMLLKSIDIKHCTVAGDTRFDRVGELPKTPFKDPIIDAFCKNKLTMVCGSTWPPDEELIAEATKKYTLKLIVAPHEINEKHLASIERLFPGKTQRYTNASSESIINSDVLIIDTIGKLSMIYRYGHIAYIGGGFGVGIHNTLEAAIYGLPVIFGPNYQRFQEACDLIKNKAAFSFSNLESLNNILSKLIDYNNDREKSGNRAKQYAIDKTGATKTILRSC